MQNSGMFPYPSNYSQHRDVGAFYFYVARLVVAEGGVYVAHFSAQPDDDQQLF